MIRAGILLLVLATGATSAFAQGRVIVIGVDGLDYEVTREFIVDGDLPALKDLSETGSLVPLYPTNPAQSPVSWATLTTGRNPGRTGINDFLRREFTKDGGIAAELAFSRTAADGPRREREEGSGVVTWIAVGAVAFLVLFVVLWARRQRAMAIGLAALVIAAGVLGIFMILSGIDESVGRELARTMKLGVPVNARDGAAVWESLDDAGVPTMSILAPMAFPAPSLDHGHLLSGLGVPDAMGTPGTYTEYREEPVPVARRITQTGCRVLPITDAGGGKLSGIHVAGPRFEKDRARVEVAVGARVDRGARSVRIDLQEDPAAIGEGAWTPFYPVELPGRWFQSLHALTRFRVLEAGDRVVLHQEPPCFDPRRQNGFIPITSPMSFGQELSADGPFDTCGWGCATNPLQDEVIGEDTFLSDIAEIEKQRDSLLWRALAKPGWRMFFCVLSTPDRVQHMYWRDRDPLHPRHDPDAIRRRGDPIRDAYKRIDALVARIRKEIVRPGDLLLVVSDHGFAPFRFSVNLNRFLAEEGFLVGTGDRTERTLETSLGGASLFPNVDWSKTRAYSMGLGKIYVNAKGEPGGIVDPADRRALLQDIRKRLFALRHEGAPVVRSAKMREEIYKGAHVEESADLIIGFERGFRVSWQSCLGSLDEPVIAPNRNLWSGDHCSVDPELVTGVLFSSRPLDQSWGDVADICPTIETALGVTPSPDQDGKPLRFKSK
jgi:predicted AlkP superfamily phosphohydrolase/phosphomutase